MAPKVKHERDERRVCVRISFIGSDTLVRSERALAATRAQIKLDSTGEVAMIPF
jgi:hypothetical protein